MFLAVGEPAPWFITASTTNPKYHFNSVAGRYVLLCFLNTARSEASQQVLTDLWEHRAMLDDEFCCFFGISTDPDDQASSRLKEHIPGIRFLWDFDKTISQKFGAIEQNGAYHPCTYVLDERLRVLAVVPFNTQPEHHVEQLKTYLSELPAIAPDVPASVQAPILVVPRIFEPELCQTLIDHYNQHGGQESGFMVEKDGRTIKNSDYGFKRRRDQKILDEDLRNATTTRIHDRLVPEIQKAFQFNATRIERYIVACYDSESGGFFRPHRDNTTKGTRHRRFAVSLNLNTGEYEGGRLRFPEFGRQTYSAPAGGAVVFSCSLLHEATVVTAGVRYAYLPFLYDETAAKIREANLSFLGEESLPADEVPQAKGFKPKASKSSRPRKKKR
ncbi:MAG: 2OG-Fe(II) oxygenase [Cyanobacteria bacterium J06626_18]